MPLHLHAAERIDALADGLADLLATPLPDPFAREAVVVPARGVERWLTQRLSHRLGVSGRGGDGVCAGVDFLTPHSLVAMVLGRERDDAWHPDRLVWPLLEVIDEALGTPGFESLTRHLGHGDASEIGELKQARRYGVARRLAGLFSSYATQRPTLVTQWREGLDTDGTDHPLDDDLLWQPELWRRLLHRVPDPAPDERHATTLAALREGGTGLDLPARLSLFGHTRLPVTEVELLSALAEHRDVHLWLPQTSVALWHTLTPTATGPLARSDDRSAELVGHPLLASLGRDSRELRRAVGAAPVSGETAAAVTDAPDTLLGWLQHDLRANAAPGAATRAARRHDASDRSVQVHACHGSARQVDVLREVLVGLLQDDPTLEPRDILVMCPDIESYAPLISAGFGLADLTRDDDGHPAHQLRVRLADRSPTATNPLLALAATLVDLAGGRLSATEVLDLAATDPVRLRWGWDDDDLVTLSGWVRSAAIRWGYDATHRGDFGLTIPDNTWLQGMRRILVGAAVAGPGHRIVGDTLPLDDVGDGHLDLVGRFSEFVDRLHTFLERTRTADTATQWSQALSDGIHQLTATSGDDVWQIAQFDREITRIAGEADGRGTTLRHADVRSLLAHRLRGRPTRSNFRTGTLTVCTMVPMRSVPHRVVCLVGMDDGVFPRTTSVDGDNVLLRRPHTGERDVRSEDRQLLLDAIGAATETLVITYAGRGEHTGAARPPAVPLGELLDALDRTAAKPVRGAVVTAHPLQPFDEANLVPGRLASTGPFTFDRTALRGAEAARGTRADPYPLVPGPLHTASPATDIALADLHDFFRHPVKAFFTSRLGISTPYEADEILDAIPITLDALQKWDVGDRLVRDVLAGADPTVAMTAEQLRGLLPPSVLGVHVLREVAAKAQPLVASAQRLRDGVAKRAVDVDIDLGDRRITGTVDDLFDHRQVTVTYSNLGPKQRIRGWLDALALACGHPDHNWTVHSIGNHRSGAQRAQIAPLPEPDARDWLRSLVDVYERGMREPLPIPVRTAETWASNHHLESRGANGHPDSRALGRWESPRFSDGGFPGDDADAWHIRAWGPDAPYESLAAPLLPDELGGAQGPHRLGHYSWLVWGPLLTSGHEQVVPG
jgi:exodeoxyribonuclease V gamma subunit